MATSTCADEPDAGALDGVAAPDAPPATPDPALRPGAVVLGRYELREQVGHGRSGAVWQAHDLLLRRDVALKTLRTSRDRDPARARWRAHHEGRAAARVHHPCLAALYDMADLDGDVVLVSEFLRGRPLGEVVALAGPLAPRHVASIGSHLAGGLAVAHAGGVVHGDVTPTTVLLGVSEDGWPDGTATLADLGVTGIEVDPRGRTITSFVAPEVAHGGPATPASDVWALGATLATAVGGHGGLSAPLGRAGALGSLLTAMLAPDPAARPEARYARAALESLLDDAESAGTLSGLAAVGPPGSLDRPGDPGEHACTAPQPRVPAAGANPPTRTWTPRTDPRPAARRRRLVGAGLLGVGVLAAGTVGAVAAAISEKSSATALPVPALGPPAPAAPVVTPPITPPVDPAPPIIAVPMDAAPVLAAASQDSAHDDSDRHHHRHGSSDHDSDGDDHGRSDRDSDDGDGDHGKKHGKKDHDSDDGDGDHGKSKKGHDSDDE